MIVMIKIINDDDNIYDNANDHKGGQKITLISKKKSKFLALTHL